MKTLHFLSLAVALTCALISEDSVAQIVHEQSGVILPATIDGMEILPRNKGGFGDFAQAFDYRNEADRIEINIFKATYPNPSVWFPYAQDLLIQRLKPGEPQEFYNPLIVAVGSSASNAIRQTYRFSKHYQSSSIAVVGFGDWLTFIMSTSKILSPAQQKARMDDILSKITTNRSLSNTVPISIIERCENSRPNPLSTRDNTELLSPISFEMSAAGGLAALVTNTDASGVNQDGLTGNPGNFCREFSASKKTSWFQRKGEDLLQTWITPVSVTGLSVQGMLVPSPTDENNENLIGAIIANNYERSSVVGFTTIRPHPVYTQITAMKGLLESPKIASVAHKSSSIELVNQEE